MMNPLKKLGLWTKVGLLNAYGPADLPPDQNPVQQTKEEHGAADDMQEMVDPSQGADEPAPYRTDPLLEQIADAEHRRQEREEADLAGEEPFAADPAGNGEPATGAPDWGSTDPALHREVQLGEAAPEVPADRWA